MEFIDNKTITSIATIKDWINTIEKAFIASNSGAYIMPRRMHIDHGVDTFLLMPCLTEEYWVTKLVSFCPRNKILDQPSIYGTLVLCNTKTGEPLAIMDGSAITAMRTAAITAIGISLLSPANSHSLGIIGTGLQGIHQTLFACSVRNINEIWAFDLSPQSLKIFSDEVNRKQPDIKIIKSANSTEVVMNSEVIITATNSQNPVFLNEKELFTGKTFIGIGSYKPDCREFPELLFRQVDRIYVDTLDGKNESGDLITSIKNGWVLEENIYPIGSLLAGNLKSTSNPTRLFKTVGSAIFDLFAAKLIYEMIMSSKNKN